MLVNDTARECSSAIIGAESRDTVIAENLDHKRILASPHPQRADAGIFRMHRHRIGDKRLRLPPASPILRLALGGAARAGIARFDGIEFDVSDFHWRY